MTSIRTTQGLLALTRFKGIGPATAEKIASRIESFDDLRSVSSFDLQGVVSQGLLSSLQTRDSIELALTEACKIIETAQAKGVDVHSIYDSSYPCLLRDIPDRPLVVYSKGNIGDLSRCAACVGTREPSEFGIEVSKRIVKKLVEQNWVIVSGLAIGIDTASHTAALQEKGRTVAVLAGGLDSVYPKQNQKLAEDILASGGALLSEQPIGTPSIPRNLIQRDRLQCGLSVGTFVMQTDIKGGTMHTVRFTLLQHRLLFIPVPKGRHALENKSRGILALAERTGNQLALDLGAEGEYKNLLTSFGNKQVSHPIYSSEDYSGVIQTMQSWSQNRKASSFLSGQQERLI